MKKPDKKPTVKLTNNDGNAVLIMGAVRLALKKAGADKEYLDKYMKDAMSGDYNNVLIVSMEYVEVE